MMKFDKYHKVKISSLDEDETIAFALFLENEKVRHETNINNDIGAMSILIAGAQFYQSAIKRHQEDVGDIDRILGVLNKKMTPCYHKERRRQNEGIS